MHVADVIRFVAKPLLFHEISDNQRTHASTSRWHSMISLYAGERICGISRRAARAPERRQPCTWLFGHLTIFATRAAPRASSGAYSSILGENSRRICPGFAGGWRLGGSQMSAISKIDWTCRRSAAKVLGWQMIGPRPFAMTCSAARNFARASTIRPLLRQAGGHAGENAVRWPAFDASAAPPDMRGLALKSAVKERK